MEVNSFFINDLVIGSREGFTGADCALSPWDHCTVPVRGEGLCSKNALFRRFS